MPIPADRTTDEEKIRWVIAHAARPLGWLDRLGYLRCHQCAGPLQRAVSVSEAPCAEEPCEVCGRILWTTAPEAQE